MGSSCSKTWKGRLVLQRQSDHSASSLNLFFCLCFSLCWFLFYFCFCCCKLSVENSEQLLSDLWCYGTRLKSATLAAPQTIICRCKNGTRHPVFVFLATTNVLFSAVTVTKLWGAAASLEFVAAQNWTTFFRNDPPNERKPLWRGGIDVRYQWVCARATRGEKATLFISDRLTYFHVTAIGENSVTAACMIFFQFKRKNSL